MSTRVSSIITAVKEKLVFRQLKGTEEINRLSALNFTLLSEDGNIEPKDLLGTSLTMSIELDTPLFGSGTRYLSGQIVDFGLIGKDGDYFAYQAIVMPWLWLATRRQDFRIFQNMTVIEMVKQVLGKYGFIIDDRTTGQYRVWEYCVQYSESDFNFSVRKLNHEGAYFYIRHNNGSHDMILGDGIGSHSPLPNGPKTINYYPGDRSVSAHGEDYFYHWGRRKKIVSGKYAALDYDFKKSNILIPARESAPGGYPFDNEEIFEWPGGYFEFSDGENYGKIRIEQYQSYKEIINGAGNARNIAPGYLVTLKGHPIKEFNREYLIIGANYSFTENVRRSDGGGHDTPTTYEIELIAVPSNVYFRPIETIEKPTTKGPQTAVVVGPAGEEIYTDEYGRVKVQFQWDRYGQNDENSSCWIRVSHSWAGTNFGTMHLPRIGQEVIVDCLNGDPDYPIIVGSVYNSMHLPPWDLPANKTQSGIKTRTSLNGVIGEGLKNSRGTANIIRFEDKEGAEQLLFHAQKDQLTEVENQEDKWVGANRNKTIDGNETNLIHKNRTETVDLDETINIHGNRTETVDKDETITIHQSRTDTVDINETRTVHQNRTRTVDHNEKITIGDNRTKTVGNSESDKIGQRWTINVGLMKMETIGVASIQTVGVSKMLNVGMAYNQNVGMTMVTNVGVSQTLSVGNEKSTTVGQKYSMTVGSSSAGGGEQAQASGAGGGSTSSITMTPDAIILKVGESTMVLTADGNVVVNAEVIKLRAQQTIQNEASTINEN